MKRQRLAFSSGNNFRKSFHFRQDWVSGGIVDEGGFIQGKGLS